MMNNNHKVHKAHKDLLKMGFRLAYVFSLWPLRALCFSFCFFC